MKGQAWVICLSYTFTKMTCTEYEQEINPKEKLGNKSCKAGSAKTMYIYYKYLSNVYNVPDKMLILGTILLQVEYYFFDMLRTRSVSDCRFFYIEIFTYIYTHK